MTHLGLMMMQGSHIYIPADKIFCLPLYHAPCSHFTFIPIIIEHPINHKSMVTQSSQPVNLHSGHINILFSI